MADEEIGYGQQVEDAPMGTPGTNPVWVRRYLSGSIYLWACGERDGDDDADLQLSDCFIGWLILLLQLLAYTTLTVRVDRSQDVKPASDDDAGEKSGYSMASVTGAMYLLVASTTSDLRAGFSLLVDGTRVGHRLFGAGLLIVYAFMIGAAMKVLLSSANDDTSVVINAVAVLFIADLDEKALKFFATVPQKWRLFWAIHSISISFALALVAVVYAGDSSKISNEDTIFENVPTWFIWVVNPGAVTMCSFVVTVILEALSNVCRETSESVDMPTLGVVGDVIYARFYAVAKGTSERVRAEPFFYAVLFLWLADGVICWCFLVVGFWFPVAVIFASSSHGDDGDDGLRTTKNIVAFVFSNMALVTGLALMVLGRFLPNRRWVTVVPAAPSHFQGSSVGSDRSATLEDSRVPSLLVGWGIGYWVTSLLYLLGGSWNGGGWSSAPTAVSVIGYVVVPCFFLATVFMVADTDFLGSRFGSFIKTSVDIFRNRRTIWYWMFATVIRDVLFMWMLMWFVLMHYLNNF